MLSWCVCQVYHCVCQPITVLYTFTLLSHSQALKWNEIFKVTLEPEWDILIRPSNLELYSLLGSKYDQSVSAIFLHKQHTNKCAHIQTLFYDS